MPSSGAELRLSYAPIVQRSAGRGEGLYAGKTVQNRNPLLNDPIFRRFCPSRCSARSAVSFHVGRKNCD